MDIVTNLTIYLIEFIIQLVQIFCVRLHVMPEM